MGSGVGRGEVWGIVWADAEHRERGDILLSSHNIVGSDPGLSWPDYCQAGLAVLSSLAVRAVCHVPWVRGETEETGHQWQVTSRHHDTITSFRKVLKLHSNKPVQFPGLTSLVFKSWTIFLVNIHKHWSGQNLKNCIIKLYVFDARDFSPIMKDASCICSTSQVIHKRRKKS